MADARSRWLAYRRTQPPPPPRTSLTVSARGLSFAVWHTPPVPDATPLVCVNGGLLFDHSLLWPALSSLAHTRQIWMYDQRGRGASAAAPGVSASRIEFDAGDLAALRTALGIERWDVLGHSWGGGIAMLAAARDPVGVRRLVLANAVGVTSRWLAPLHDTGIARLRAQGHLDAAERLATMGVTALHAPVPEAHADYTQAYFPAWFADPAFARGVVPPRALSVTGAHVVARLRREGYDWTRQLGALRAPTLVLHGSDDVLPLAEAANTARVLTEIGVSVRFEPLAGAGHNPFWEAPAPFFASVLAFLSVPDPPRAPPDT